MSIFVRLVLAFFLPPMSVYLTAIERGSNIEHVNFRTLIDHEHEMTIQLALSIVLCFMLWVPAVIHAIAYATWPMAKRLD